MIAVNKRLAGKRSRSAGVAAEDLVRAHLMHHGYQCVERVHTPWAVQRNAQGRICGARPVEKVSGDFRAVGPYGVSVLVEVKYRPNKLTYSDLATHQWDALRAHRKAGGWSLIAWVHERGVSLFRDDELAKGKSLKLNNAVMVPA